MRRPVRLALEALEDRCTPATWGNPWPDAEHLTVSFAPDGTAVGDQQSQLFQALNAQVGAAWRREFLRALQTWAASANINLSLVADGGQALGTAGAPQGDARFGDLRISGVPMPANPDAAVATPFDATAGTWAGDVRLNSAANFGAGGYDLYTVALHEAGHALGLDHINDPASVMYEEYLGPRTGLSAVDVQAIQALYGARVPDAFEGSAGNGSLSTATSLVLPKLADGSLALTVNAELTTQQDADYYRFTTPLAVGGLTVRLQTSGVSLLTARVTLYNSSGKALASAVATDPSSGDLVIQLPSASILTTYYVKVERAAADVFGVGSYQLQINYVPNLSGVVGAVTGLVSNVGTVLLNNDLHTDDTMLTALNLRQLVFATDTRFDYAFTGSISDSRDVDFYRLTAPTPAAGQANVLTAMVWGKEPDGLLPRVTVFDGSGNEVRAEVLVNDGISYTVQVPNAVAGATYFVRVRAADAQGARNTGNYFLGVDFSAQAATLETITGGALDQTAPQQTGTLTVTEDQMFHFLLSADRADMTVMLTVFDRSGRAVATLAARGGEAVSLDLFLAAGAYTFQFTATANDGGPLPKTNYLLRASSISKPIGPEPADPTSSPTGTKNDASTPPYSYSGGNTSGTSSGGTTSGGTTSSPSGDSSYPSGYSDPYQRV